MIVQRYYITPPTEAEIAKAMQDDPSTAVDDSAHKDGSATVQDSQQGASAQMAQGQSSIADADERSLEIGCCGYYLVFGFGKRRPQ